MTGNRAAYLAGVAIIFLCVAFTGAVANYGTVGGAGRAILSAFLPYAAP